MFSSTSRILKAIPRSIPLILKKTSFNRFMLSPALVQKFHSMKSLNILETSTFTHRPTYNFAAFPAHTKLSMPALSPTMKTGTIAKWTKQPGDKLGPGDVICEVETDKASVGFEMQEEGYLAKILLPEGAKDVPVGQIVAIMVDSLESVKAFENYTLDAAGNAPAAEEKPAAAAKEEKPAAQAPPKKTAAGGGKKYPKHDKVPMPALSPTMKSGKIASWSKKEGDKLSPGDILCEVETDKASVGFEIQEEGYLAKILVAAGGNDINVGELVAIFVESEADVAAFKTFALGAEEEGPAEEVAGPGATPVTLPPGARVFISPLAKKTALDNKIPVEALYGKGTGPNGRVLVVDVEKFIASGGVKKAEAKPQAAAAPAKKDEKKPAAGTPPPPKKAVAGVPENPFVDIPLTNMRKVIATRILEAKSTIPHFYLTISITMDEVLKLREMLNKETKVKISVNDMLIKAAGLACVAVPEVNSQWLGDKIRQYKNCDCSIAVSTDTGLITPIIFNANHKGFNEIAKNAKELAEKARKGALKPAEFQGGTFCISNLGMFGIDQFSAVINPPQACILAVGKTEKAVVPAEIKDPAKDHGYKVISTMRVTLSCDHRLVDGSVGARWLQSFKDLLEKPFKMML